MPKRTVFVTPGQRFGRLTVIRETRHVTPSSNSRAVIADCDCGIKNITVILINMVRGSSQSCGCLHKERAGDAQRTHGLSRHSAYGSWECMMGRCFNPKDVGYKRYGGRGITVCDRWLDPTLFIADMGATHELGLTLERGDNDGNYEPSNVTWTTRRKQAHNRRKQSNNTSGKSGVTKASSRSGGGGRTYWEARWRDVQDVDHRKLFSIDDLGDEEAYLLASTYRDARIAELDYTEKHGQ